MLKGQIDIFFFDIINAREPKFLKSTRAPNSSITDDFLALPEARSSSSTWDRPLVMPVGASPAYRRYGQKPGPE